MNLELKRIIDQVSRDKGIDKDLLVGAIKDAIRSAAKKKYGPRLEIEVEYRDETGEIEVFQYKEVVEEVKDPSQEISLEEGRIQDPECEVGDSLGFKMDASAFGRIAAQSAKQVIMQRMKDAERDLVYEDYKDRKGEIMNGIVQRLDPEGIIVNLGRTEALLPPMEQVPREIYHKGERIRAYVLDVKRQTRGPQIILSRTHPQFLMALFECRGAGDFRRHRPGSGLRPGAGQPFQDCGILPGLGRGPGGGLRRHEGGPGPKHRAGTAGREDRHHPLASRPGQVCHQCPGPGPGEPHHPEQGEPDHGGDRAG